MEKEIYRRHLTRGCVWVFMSMFDFKHGGGGSNQKLLIDKKHGSKRIFETTIVEKQLSDNEESEGEMQSVKKLIEEEIDEEKKKTKSRKKRINSRNSSEDNNVLDAINDDDEDHAKSDYDSEEKFSELIKRLIAQKKILDQELDSKEDSKRMKETIVILKPEDDLGSSSPGVDSNGNKVKNGRFGSSSSRFLLSRIRRSLKFSLGNTPCNITQQDSDQDAMSQNHNIDSRSEASIHGNGDEDPKKSMCGIYIAAKKHLSEMLAEGGGGDIDVDLPEKEAPRILGKILALPEFSTPENSPRMSSAPKIIQQCSSELDSNKHEETEFMSDIDNEKKEEEEKIVLDSLSEAISSSVIQEDAYVDQDEHKQEQETFDEKHSLSSPPRMSECQENAIDFPGKSSPVSVLEPFFTDDELSPNTSKFSSSVERRMQPLCIRFDEPESPRRPNKDNDVDDKELTLEYIQAILKSSELNWEEILSRTYYSDQLLEQALMEDIDFCANNFCDDKKLLFDCINEVLTEFCAHGPWILRRPEVMENVVQVVQEEVYWYLLPLPSPHTLDQIVKKDFAKSGRSRWMDLRFDVGFIVLETGEIILDELLEEIISNFTE